MIKREPELYTFDQLSNCRCDYARHGYSQLWLKSKQEIGNPEKVQLQKKWVSTLGGWCHGTINEVQQAYGGLWPFSVVVDVSVRCVVMAEDSIGSARRGS